MIWGVSSFIKYDIVMNCHNGANWTSNEFGGCGSKATKRDELSLFTYAVQGCQTLPMQADIVVKKRSSHTWFALIALGGASFAAKDAFAQTCVSNNRDSLLFHTHFLLVARIYWRLTIVYGAARRNAGHGERALANS